MRDGAARRMVRGLAWVVALGGLAALALAVALDRAHEQRLEALAGEAASLRAGLDRDRALLAVLGDPGARAIALVGAGLSPAARGHVVWHERAGGLLVVAGLPPVPAGAAYQVWALAGTRPPVPVGVIAVDARGAGSLRLRPLAAVPRVEGFLVTLEPAGGAAAPSGPVHLVTRR